MGARWRQVGVATACRYEVVSGRAAKPRRGRDSHPPSNGGLSLRSDDGVVSPVVATYAVRLPRTFDLLAFTKRQWTLPPGPTATIAAVVSAGTVIEPVSLSTVPSLFTS
jgi:hypothetical protein